MKRIFPINVLEPSTKWRGYSNYLTWLKNDTTSIQDYLDYYQRTFSIINQDSITRHPILKNSQKIRAFVQSSYLFHDLIIYEGWPKPTKLWTKSVVDDNRFVNSQNLSWEPMNLPRGIREYYEVLPGQTISVTWWANSGLQHVAPWSFLDENENILTTSSFNSTGENEKITAPAMAKYLVLQILDSGNGVSISNTLDSTKVLRNRKIIFPFFLKWKEGVYNPYYETYISFQNLDENWDASANENKGAYMISEGEIQHLLHKEKLEILQSSFILFAKKWTHNGTFSPPWPAEVKTPTHYISIAQSFSSLYEITGGENKLIARYLSDGPGVTGTKLTLSFELSPSRYFIVYENQKKWDLGGVDWVLYNYDISTLTKPQIVSSKKTTWINAFPILSELYFKTTSQERFICDRSWGTEETNIENKRIVAYTINSNVTDGSLTEGWSNIHINLI